MVEMYGIPNCDTIRKARRWLADHNIAYVFHDYKKEAVNVASLTHWVDQLGWEVILNKRGTTWRKLSDDEKESINRDRAIALMCKYPSMIKRPVLIVDDGIEVGFSELRYAGLLG